MGENAQKRVSPKEKNPVSVSVCGGCVWVGVYVCVCARVGVHVYVCDCMCVCMCEWVCVDVCVRPCVRVCVSVCMSVCFLQFEACLFGTLWPFLNPAYIFYLQVSYFEIYMDKIRDLLDSKLPCNSTHPILKTLSFLKPLIEQSPLTSAQIIYLWNSLPLRQEPILSSALGRREIFPPDTPHFLKQPLQNQTPYYL